MYILIHYISKHCALAPITKTIFDKNSKNSLSNDPKSILEGSLVCFNTFFEYEAVQQTVFPSKRQSIKLMRSSEHLVFTPVDVEVTCKSNRNGQRSIHIVLQTHKQPRVMVSVKSTLFTETVFCYLLCSNNNLA